MQRAQRLLLINKSPVQNLPCIMQNLGAALTFWYTAMIPALIRKLLANYCNGGTALLVLWEWNLNLLKWFYLVKYTNTTPSCWSSCWTLILCCWPSSVLTMPNWDVSFFRGFVILAWDRESALPQGDVADHCKHPKMSFLSGMILAVQDISFGYLESWNSGVLHEVGSNSLAIVHSFWIMLSPNHMPCSQHSRQSFRVTTLSLLWQTVCVSLQDNANAGSGLHVLLPPMPLQRGMWQQLLPTEYPYATLTLAVGSSNALQVPPRHVEILLGLG